jgi:ABC-type Na+ transport system ATPase subunit NatA
MIRETGGNNMILEVRNLVKRYKNLLAVDNVNLAINEGEIFGLQIAAGQNELNVLETFAVKIIPNVWLFVIGNQQYLHASYYT